MIATRYKEIPEQEYIPIEIDKLVPEAPLPFDIYSRDKSVINHLFNKGTIFTNLTKDSLKEKGITEVYLMVRDEPDLNDYLSKSKPHKSISFDPVAFKKYSSCKEQYYQIDRNLLRPRTEINFSLFVLERFDICILAEATEKSPVKVDEHILNTTGDILIKKTDIPRYNDYLNSLLSETDIPETEKAKMKAGAIKENSKIIIKDLLDNPRSGEKIKESMISVNNVIDCIMENKDAIYDLLSLRNYDYYTYTHSVNVAVLSVGLGITIDLKRAETEKLGIGTMLHDVGKGAIPPEILNKQGKLNNAEFEIIKNHVIEGEKILRMHKEIPEESFIAVLQHHEKLTGKGYPFNLSGDRIKIFGRITAITDCYDALTSRRPYRPALTPFDALSIITKETGNYDTELLATFIKMLGGII